MKHYNFIYCITNLINGKKYIGKHSTDILNDMYYGSGLYITKAIKKYGLCSFKKEILEFVLNNYTDLKNAENYWIQKLNTKTPNGYNIAEGGTGGNLGDQVLQKISKKLKGRVFTNEWKQKISNSLKGRTIDPEQVRRSIETRKKRKELGLYERVISNETRKKISEHNKGKIPWNKGLNLKLLKADSYKKMWITRKKNILQKS